MEPAALQTQQAGGPPIPIPQQGDADPPPLSSGRDWAFRLVRGSMYVAGERVESMARDGRRAVEMAAAAAAAGASGGLTPGVCVGILGWVEARPAGLDWPCVRIA